MALRVVVYAEGGLDLGGEKFVDRRASTPIEGDAFLGPAHFIVRRALGGIAGVSEGDVRFEEPLRDGRGRRPTGTALLHPPTLKQLLTWVRAENRPDLAIVLVDADGETQRYRDLQKATEKVAVTRVFGVAVQEFESWLIADQRALNRVFKKPVSSTSAIESLGRGDAKRLLDGLIGSSKDDQPRVMARRQLAMECDLDEVTRRCSAFETFRKDLKAAVRPGT